MSDPRTRASIDAVLVSFRDSGDPMIEHERSCFCDAAGLAGVRVVSAITDGLHAGLLDADLLLFGGSGTHGVNDAEPWLQSALDFLLEVAARGVPAWASCFGFQGLAVALGGSVVRDDSRKRIGAHPLWLTAEAAEDALFSELPETFGAQFGHHDHVQRVPAGVTVLATGEAGDCLAFRVNGSQLWGAQFHAELDKRTSLDRWNHYRPLYAGEDGPVIDRHIQDAPDTPRVKRVLADLVRLTAEHRVSQ